MKNSTPISLFSFQDIITSLTGIMIVVVLVILLQLVEASRATLETVQLQPEYQLLKKMYKELLTKQENLKKKIVANAEAADKYAQYSVEEINQQIRNEDIYSKVIEQKIAQHEKILSDLVLQNAKAELNKTHLKEELAKLSKDENEIRELKAQLLSLQKMKKNIATMIQRKRRLLHFEFSGYDSQTPLLIECNSWGFKCKRYPDGEIKVLGASGKTRLTQNITALKKWLNNNDAQNSYPVLLFKENSLIYYDDICKALWDVYQKISWGQELIRAQEEIF